jgi:hypothetical protein
VVWHECWLYMWASRGFYTNRTSHHIHRESKSHWRYLLEAKEGRGTLKERMMTELPHV